MRATALFAHCFTCGKDLRVERQLTQALTAAGFAVLSFDFAGLGHSEGDFAESSFSADLADLRAAADYLGETIAPPSLLVGHSLGGAAVLSVAASLPSVEAVATIGAPADPAHVLQILDGDLEAVRRDGSGPVTIGGRTFQVGAEFLADLERDQPQDRIGEFRGATLLIHSPIDQTVSVDNAESLYRQARHPKSFIALDDGDHLVTDPADAAYLAGVIAAWADRYVTKAPDSTDADTDATYAAAGVVARNLEGFRTTLDSRGFRFVADEPAEAGGGEEGPSPYDFLAMALASCTAMTMRLYAEHKGWELGALEVIVEHERVHADDCAACEHDSGHIDVLQRHLVLPEGLSQDQRDSLVRIADRCPVHRTLEGQLEVHTTAG